MKRLIAIVLMSLFGFAFGCGGANKDAPATAETADEAAAPAEGAAAGDETAAPAEGAADEAAPAEGAAAEPAAE